MDKPETQKKEEKRCLPAHYPTVIPLEDEWLDNIPDDYYEPAYSYFQYSKSSEDSIAGGHYLWRKNLIGYLGKETGVMLAPEWGEILESI